MRWVKYTWGRSLCQKTELILGEHHSALFSSVSVTSHQCPSGLDRSKRALSKERKHQVICPANSKPRMPQAPKLQEHRLPDPECYPLRSHASEIGEDS